MKRMIKASSKELTYEQAMKKASKILDAAKKLFDELEDTPAGFLKKNDMEEVYDVLADFIPQLSWTLDERDIDY